MLNVYFSSSAPISIYLPLCTFKHSAFIIPASCSAVQFAMFLSVALDQPASALFPFLLLLLAFPPFLPLLQFQQLFPSFSFFSCTNTRLAARVLLLASLQFSRICLYFIPIHPFLPINWGSGKFWELELYSLWTWIYSIVISFLSSYDYFDTFSASFDLSSFLWFATN